MRALTKTIFEREGKAIVGPRWTMDQVRQAYEKVDDLVDYISEYKAFKPVQKMGLDKIHPGFENGLEIRVAKNLPDEAVQSLSLDILGKLLEKGRHILRSAAWVYRNSPDTFKNVYASSKQAFLKDRFFLQKVPTYSFSPFKTGDNPAIIRDEKLSQICADLYNSVREPLAGDNIPLNYTIWLGAPAGDKFSRETSWLQNIVGMVHQKQLGITRHSDFVIASKKQNTL